MSVPFQCTSNCLHVPVPSVAVLSGTLGGNGPISMREDLAQDEPKRVDIRPAIKGCTGNLFRRHIVWRAGRLLQNGIIIRIGQAEINDFHIIAIACDQDVSGFEITVKDLLAMDIIQRIDKLVHHFGTHFRRGIAGQERIESDAINVFHHDARSNGLIDLFGVGFDDVRVVELHHQRILFLQEFPINGLVAILRFQAFQDEPSALTLGFYQTIETASGQFLKNLTVVIFRQELFVDGT